MLSGPADYGARVDAALRGEHDAIFRTAHAAGAREATTAYRIDALLAVLERGAALTPDEAAPAEDPAQPHDAGEAEERHRNATQTPADPGTADTPHSATEPAGENEDAAAGTATPPPTGGTTKATRPAGHPPAPTGATGATGATRATRATRATAPRRLRRRSGRETKIIITIDAAGRLHPDDTCHIAGIGPVSLSAVRSLIPDAHIAYVIRDATDVAVAHLGRQATAHQRTAMEARGYECEVPGCRATHLLEIDHVRDWAFSRHTTLTELAWPCPRHHDRKSTDGYRLSGPPGHRRWHDPTGKVITRDPDPPTATAA